MIHGERMRDEGRLGRSDSVASEIGIGALNDGVRSSGHGNVLHLFVLQFMQFS